MRLITTIFLGVLALDAVVVTFLGLVAKGRERRRIAKGLPPEDYLSEYDGEDWMYREITDEEFREAMEHMMERE